MLQVCHFFQATGKCRFGKRCRFKHIFKEGEALSAITFDCTADSNLSVAEPEPQTPQSRSTIYSHTGIKENQDEALSGESFSDRPLCWAFSERGWCRFGQHCRYLHIKVKKPQVKQNRAPGVEPRSLKANRDDIDPVQENLYPHESGETTNKRKICKTFADQGSCRYGSRCQFLHFKLVKPEAFASQLENEEEKEEEISIKKESFSESLQTPKQDNAENLEKETAASAKQTRLRRICRFIKSGNCKFGKNCKFYHPQGLLDIKNELPEERKMPAVNETMEIIKDDKIEQDKVTDAKYKVQQNVSAKYTPFKPQGFIPTYKRGEATTEQLMELREIEIKHLKKRFTKDTLAVTEESEKRFTCKIAFSSSDPDWPFDVKVFDLELDFPTPYPEQLFSVTLPSDQNLPETVRRYIEVVIQEWLESKMQDLKARGVIELVLRSFLRWLDRNLEGVVTEALRQLKKELAAKAAGLEFITVSQLKRKQKQSESEAHSNDDDGTNRTQSTSNPSAVEKTDVIIYRKMDVQEVYQGPGRNQKDSDETKEKIPTSEDGDSQKGFVLDDDRRGTEVALKNLQLLDSAATLLFEKIYIIIQCERCSSKTEFSTPAGRVNSVVCVKCSNTMVAFFRSALVHQFSSVLGYLELQGCKAFDLVMQESAVKLGCLNCSQEVTLKSIAPGILSEMWCHSCHDKMRVATDGVRFTNLAPAEVTLDASKVHQIAVQKKQRLPKDPAIQEGRPLPDYGTCKHFKKSYRWLRFPCCGKCYPCDVCHEEKEGDHEMKYATRMICGFCCKEQPYSSEKPCISCSHNVVKSRTEHWEGGKGCRDKITMSKNDKQKYTNLSKTTSNRAVRLQKISKGQKNTKLRHN